MRIQLIGALAAVLGAAPLMAQGKGKGNDGVPPGQRPVPGMCRIWIDGVPPGKQPAPTDCATAVARRPANARVIFGDDTPKPGQGKSGAENGVCLAANRSVTVLGIPVPVSADDRTICRGGDDDDDRDVKSKSKSKGRGGR